MPLPALQVFDASKVMSTYLGEKQRNIDNSVIERGMGLAERKMQYDEKSLTSSLASDAKKEERNLASDKQKAQKHQNEIYESTKNRYLEQAKMAFDPSAIDPNTNPEGYAKNQEAIFGLGNEMITELSQMEDAEGRPLYGPEVINSIDKAMDSLTPESFAANFFDEIGRAHV